MNLNITAYPLLTVMLLLSAGCGSVSSRPGVTASLETEVPLHLRVERAREGRLFCQGSNCDPRVVMLSMVSKKGVTRCSGVLIDSDHVLTNDHCISDALSLSQSSCTGLVYFHLSAHESLPAKTVGCSRVIARSYQTGADTKDYAVLKLSESIRDRTSVVLRTTGLQRNERVSIKRVNMISNYGSLDGQVENIQCRASYETVFFPVINDARFPVMTFGHCPIIHGNSGSPAFDESGKLVAIMQGYFEPKPDSAFLGALNQLKLDSKFGTLAVGTQLHCISELNPGSARQCFPQTKLSAVNVQGYMSDQASLIQLPEVMSDGVMQSSVSEVWMRLKNSSLKQPVYVKVPSCFQQQNTVFEIRKYSLGINRYYQAEYRNQNKSDFIYFSAKKTHDSNEMRLTSEIGEVQIPFCPVTAI